MLGKMHSFPSKPSASRAACPLGLLHSDVCGPFPVKILTGKRYWLTIFDAHRKYALVRFVAQKSDVSGELRAAIVMLERQLRCPVKALRSDGGGEYMAGSLQQFPRERGIVHQMSHPYHPQQNGAASTGRCWIGHGR
jgi:transposase InsO family protein